MSSSQFDSVEILPADKEHLEEIRQLARQIWFAHYPGIISVDQINYMLERDYDVGTLAHDLDNGVSIDRLMVDGELRGFAAYGPCEDSLDCKLHKIYLGESFHGLGLGSMILRNVEAQCAARGATRVILSVNKHNEKAIRAYEHNGYARLESVVVDIGGGFVMDDYIMGKELA